MIGKKLHNMIGIPLENKIKGIIFDLDGTLINSTNIWHQIDIDFLGKRGLELTDEYVRKIAHMGFDESAVFTINHYGLDENPKDIVKEWFEMAYYAYANTITLKEGVREFLELLKERKITMSIATASDLSLVEPVLRNNGIYDLFQNITMSCEVERGKGFPDVYMLAAKRMGFTEKECIVFEDILPGIKGAHDGGFKTVGVFDENCKDIKEEVMAGCDLYIENYGEILPL